MEGSQHSRDVPSRGRARSEIVVPAPTAVITKAGRAAPTKTPLLREIVATTGSDSTPGAAQAAGDWIAGALPSHWDAASGLYKSLLPPIDRHGNPPAQYEPSIDAIMA